MGLGELFKPRKIVEDGDPRFDATDEVITNQLDKKFSQTKDLLNREDEDQDVVDKNDPRKQTRKRLEIDEEDKNSVDYMQREDEPTSAAYAEPDQLAGDYVTEDDILEKIDNEAAGENLEESIPQYEVVDDIVEFKRRKKDGENVKYVGDAAKEKEAA